MSQDQFKEFVASNREAFEAHNQDFQEIWTEIERGLEKQVSPWRTNWMRVAAAVLVLIVCGWSVFSYQSRVEIPYELQETEQHYSRLINLKLEKLSAHQNNIDALIWEDLEVLDREYEELKRDLIEGIDQEEVAQAMVENQIAKLEILGHILEELESKMTTEDADEIEI